MSETPSLYDARRGDAWLFGSNAPYAEEMYQHWLENPASVPDTWRAWFESLQLAPTASGHTRDVAHTPIIAAFAARARAPRAPAQMLTSAHTEAGRKRTAVQQLIAAHRNLGARWAQLDPLQRAARPDIPELQPSFYGLSDADMD